MVGIAGEDDLDAPPDATTDPAEGHKAADRGLSPNPSVAQAPARQTELRTGNPTTPPVREKLSMDESAATTAQLIREIETQPEHDLQYRAIGILKAKNRLSADDAKRVEDAFAARMALPGVLVEARQVNEPTTAAMDPEPPQPPSVPTETVKLRRGRGRPRKVQAATEQSAALLPSPQPTIDVPPAATTLEAEDTPAKIQKSELAISEPRRIRDKGHLKFVASQSCLVCGRSPADAHHLRFTQPRAMERKVSDEFTVPLCRVHHRDNHNFGDEVTWWERRAIDPVATSRMLWVSTRRIE
jgi:hypothetical protein